MSIKTCLAHIRLSIRTVVQYVVGVFNVNTFLKEHNGEEVMFCRFVKRDHTEGGFTLLPIIIMSF